MAWCRFSRLILTACMTAIAMALNSSLPVQASELPACYRQTTKDGFVSLRVVYQKVAAFSEMLKGETITEDEVQAAGGSAFSINVLLGMLVGDPAQDYNCAICDPAAIAPGQLDNRGYDWSALGMAERFSESADRMADQHTLNADVEQISEIASKTLARTKSRKQLPFCANAPAQDGSQTGTGEGTPVCYKGSYVHTGGPREGKVQKSTICIDWSAPCKLTGKGIKRQSPDSCTPKKAIRIHVDMQSGVSLVYDLKVVKGKLRGSWEQSDGAYGEWR
jgi:hypothetical protein